MKQLPKLVCLLVLCLALLPGAQPAAGAPRDGWETLAPGIDYQEFFLPGPNKVYVSRLDRSNPNVTLETILAKGRLGSREKISAQYQRYDQTINTWGTWGNRSKAVVAINGSYEFALDNTHIFPQSGVVQSGWYVYRYKEFQPSGFAWWPDRSAFIGGCVSNPPARQTVTLPGSIEVPIDRLNAPRGSGELVLYTPQYNSSTLTDEFGTEVVVQLNRPASIQVFKDSPVGTVVEIRKNQGSTPIPFDSVVISASGDPASKLNDLQAGDRVTVAQLVKACNSNETDPPLTGAYTAMTGDFHFLESGQIQYFPDKPAANVPDSHTAIAFNNQYVYFIVNDGPNPTLPRPGDVILMKGMTITELARFARDQLQAREAIAEDSGGSSTIVVNGVVRNFPTDGIPRGPEPGAPQAGLSLYLPLIGRRDALPTPVPQPTPLPPPNPAIKERPVINGMMMVVVEPKEQSPRFSANQQVLVTQNNTFVRLGPGDNYEALATAPLSATGVVMAHPLQGVQARWTYWWEVDFGGGLQGWVDDEALTAAP